MSLNRYIDQSLDQIIKETRQQKKPQSAKKLAPAAAELVKRRAKNKPSAAMATDVLAGRVGRSAGISTKVLAKGRLAGRVGKAAAPKPKAASAAAAAAAAAIGSARLAGIAQRMSPAAKKQPPAPVDRRIAIKGEAGPAAVFISNLDTEASTEDVKTCFKQFGAIKSCTLLYDSNGRASGHAEITYTAKAAAEEAVAKLNNALADGRRLSVKLVPASKAPSGPALAPFASASAPAPHAPVRKAPRKQRRAGARMDLD